jgi:two-component system nitrogen regulation sensor histidine kinase NtrY
MGPRERAEVLAVAFVAAGLLAAGLLVWWRPGRELPAWIAAAWALPFALAAAVLPRSQAGRGALLPWVTAGWIAGTMALSSLWVLHQEARVRAAERELARLGTAADPFLDFLLRQFAEKVLFYAAEGREGVSLLYQSWVEAGLAEEGYEARLTLWDGDAPVEELRLADTQVPVAMVPRMLAAARASEEPVLERHTDLDSIHYLLAVALPGGRTVSVAVPPRRHIGRSTVLARFLDPAARDDEGTADLSLVPPPPGEPDAPEAGAMTWVGETEGWRSEAVVRFPGGPMHAHLLVRTPATAMLLVRGLLALIGVLLVLAVAWVAARTLCGEPMGLPSGRRAWLSTFRGRLTLALFGFFLVPMLAFAGSAYRALAQEVVRTAGAVAQRALGQAEADIGMGSLEDLGRRVGAELLLYHQGVLVEGSTPEVIEMGLYHAWLTPEAYLGFLRAEHDERQEEVRRLAGSRYLVAYRRLGPVDVLAAPTPLASGEIARRQRELASVVLLAALAGGALSVVLSLLVGRALSRPIDVLSQAAADVGRGDLGVRLPARRRDEFGGLYRSFNQMVRGLRHARGALERETRRTEAIVAEAGTGVVALDGGGRVALINPRACQILGAEIAPGSRIPQDEPLTAAVALAVSRFLAEGAREWSEEREVDGRVVRLRLRRLQAEGGRGAVLVLEDVTAELRSARVLAWGEMARQVAHEIKNPLTPIKLAVQHIRRAHADRRENFGGILDRNVDAVLQEIDRLGEIARAFARFGAPGDPAEPAVPVDVAGVARETLALYRGGQDGITYRVEVEPDTPRAFARVGELKEVLVNVLENARAALPEGGEVRIGAGPAGGGAWVRLDVADTGEGIPAESLPRIFEPQFSTRSSGTGLGLAIVKRLVESWGGEITVDSDPGAGTTVHLRLRAEAAATDPSVERPSVDDGDASSVEETTADDGERAAD